MCRGKSIGAKCSLRIPLLDFRWAALATFVVLEIPLSGLRWRRIVDALRDWRADDAYRHDRSDRYRRVLRPGLAERGRRGVRAGCSFGWGGLAQRRNERVIDRGVGVGLLIALDLSSCCCRRASPRWADIAGWCSSFTARFSSPACSVSCSHRRSFAARSVAIFPLVRNVGYRRPSRSARAEGAMILGIGCLIHALPSSSFGRSDGRRASCCPLPDAAVLFTVMIGVVLVPISIGGWGLRELAVISLLGNHGMAPEQALLFSVCFGLAWRSARCLGHWPGCYMPSGPCGVPPSAVRETRGRPNSAPHKL